MKKNNYEQHVVLDTFWVTVTLTEKHRTIESNEFVENIVILTIHGGRRYARKKGGKTDNGI